ncbi:hypothetical protein [Streptomyces xanthophaeus]
MSSLSAERFAKRRAQRTLILTGFTTTIAGIVVLIVVVGGSPSPGPSHPDCSSSASDSA